MLIKNSDITSILRCPCTKQKLFKKNDSIDYFTTNDTKHIYEVWNDLPILIDNEKSIVTLQNFKSYQPVIIRKNYKGVFSFLKKILSPNKSKTKENVNILIQNLKGLSKKPKVLIVGGGTIGQGMDYFYNSSEVDLVSFDIYISSNVNFIADAHQIPLRDGHFDAVIIQAVLEHVLEPHKVVREIYRVLKPNGFVYAETPFLQQVHEGAYDFTRFTERGHRYLFRQFISISSGCTAGTGSQMLWSIDYFFRGLFRSRFIGKIAKLSFFWIRCFDYLIPERYNMDSASGVFFLGSKSGEEIHAKDIPKCYKGTQ